MSTKIEWTDETWNPVRGCTIVSEGCKNCYAMKFAHRFSGEGKPYEGLTRQTSTGPKWTGRVNLIWHELDKPRGWKKPRRVFVCSMSDLFHFEVPDEYIRDVLYTIAECPQHTFQILTKRPHRAAEFFKEWESLISMPIQNLWIGTSIEDQKTANERIPHLLEIPAAVRFLSCEPLLGPVEINFTDRVIQCVNCEKEHLISARTERKNGVWRTNHCPECYHDSYFKPENGFTKINWVIAGGESGPGARPMHPDWVRSLRDQCQEAEVPFFFKQWGEWLPLDHLGEDLYWHSKESREVGYGYTSNTMFRVGKKHSGNFLDGKQHLEFPSFTKATEGAV